MVSCLDRPGVDRRTNRFAGGDSRVLIIGSDSPSKTAALVSCSRDELRCCRVSFGRVVGIVGVLGLWKGRLMVFCAVSARVLSEVIEPEALPLAGVNTGLRVAPIHVSDGNDFTVEHYSLLPGRKMEKILTLPLRMLLMVRPAELLLRFLAGFLEHPDDPCRACSARRTLAWSWEPSRRLRDSFRFRVGTSAIILAAVTGG